MKGSKAVSLLVLLFFVAFGVWAGGDQEGQDADGPVELRVGWWGNADRDQLYYAINDLYMAENPNVEITTMSPGWNDYWVQIATMYAGGTAPDVVQFQANQIGEYCSKGVLTPLQPYVDSGVIDLNNWNMEFVNTGNYEGELYMITIGMTSQAMYLNETWIEELGYELWDFDQNISWAEFEDWMIELQAHMPEGAYAGMDFYDNSDLAWIFIRQHMPAGTEWVDADGNFAVPVEVLEEWYAMGERLRQAGAFPPLGWFQEWRNKPWQDGVIANRRTVYRAENANKYALFSAYSDDDIAIRRVQTAPDGENPHGELLITSALGISETSDLKDVAADYINFFVNNEEAQIIFSAEVGVPGSLSIQQAIAPHINEFDVIATDYLNMVSADTAPFLPKPPGIWALQNEIRVAGEAVSFGEMTPREAAEYIVDIANETIADNL